MSDRCYTTQGIHIPGCMSCAVYDHSRCTCPPKSRPSDKDVLARVTDLERHVASLEKQATP